MSPLTTCLIICVVTIAAYIYGKPSLSTIALTSLAAFVITGCITPADALGYFGNANVVMIAGMFVVAAGFNKTQFVQNVATGISGLAKGSLTKILIGYVLMAVILAQFIQSAIVVFGIVIPLATATCKQANISPTKVIYPIGVSAVVTTSCVPIGAGATVAAELNGYLAANDYTAYTVALTDPMKARLPIMIACIIYMIWISPKFSPDEPLTEMSNQIAENGGSKEALKPFQERCGYIIFIAVALALIFSAQIKQPAWIICMVGALLMIFTGVLKPAEAVRSMNMSIVLLIVGSLAMGGALSATGAGDLVGGFIANLVSGIENKFLIGLIFFLPPYLLTQFMLNRSVMLIFIPIAIVACKAMGANPVGIVIMVQAACLTAFVTPMSCPVAAMITGQGGYTFKSILKQSVFPAAIFTIIAVFWIMTVFPL